MIRLPEGFVPIIIPGYYWHVELQELFSIKSGSLEMILKNLKHYKGYKIACRSIPYSYFEALTIDWTQGDYVIPVCVWDRSHPAFEYFKNARPKRK